MFSVPPHIQTVAFKNGTKIDMKPGSILVAVGPNNAGKSKFLKQLYSRLYGRTVAEQTVDDGLISSIRICWGGGSDDLASDLISVAEKKWTQSDRYFKPSLSSEHERYHDLYSEEDLRAFAYNQERLGPFVGAFARWDEPHSRITESEKQVLSNSSGTVVTLVRNDSELEEVSSLFEQIFDQRLSVYDLRDGKAGFVLGDGPQNPSTSTRGLDPKTREFMLRAPKLWLQGSGMRNVFGLLSRIEADDRNIVIMDEPEAFLHPHQSWKLGLILGTVCREKKKQLICATHDRHFLTGLAQGAGEKLQICRFSTNEYEAGRTFDVQIVPDHFWRDIRDQSRVRFSQVLDSFFFDEVVLVEGEEDALFYQEALTHYFETNQVPESERGERLFLPTGGNSEFAPMARLVKSLGPKVVAIGDIDLIADEKRYAATVQAFGETILDEAVELQEEIAAIYRDNEQLGESRLFQIQSELEERLGSDQQSFDEETRKLLSDLLSELNARHYSATKNRLQSRMAKNANTRSENEEVVKKVTEVVDLLRGINLFLVPMGALEHFDQEILREGKRGWVRRALDAKVHQAKLAQDFIFYVASRRSER